MASPCVFSNPDSLQIDEVQLRHATNKAREYWHGAIATVSLQNFHDRLPEIFVLKNLLRKVPTFPSTHCSPTKICSGGGRKSLTYSGSSVWNVIPTDAKCGIGDRTRKIGGFIEVGVERPTAYQLTDDADDRALRTHILSLAWAYIFSKRMAELCKTDTNVRYTDDVAGLSTIPGDFVSQGARVSRWWKAVLALGRGWLITLTSDDGDPYHTPWAVLHERPARVHPIEIMNETSNSRVATLEESPLSAEEAFEALVHFCINSQSHNQFYTSLAAVTTFPTHNRHGNKIQLLPSLTNWANDLEARADLPSWSDFEVVLRHYMTLSCSPDVVLAALCGTFWERGIGCNRVSTWLHPILEELHCAVEQNQYWTLVTLLGIMRRPQISLLWIGAAGSGLIPTILNRVKLATPPIEPHVWPWMGILHSFMDDVGSGPYFSGRSATREDVWRLLFLPPLTDDDNLHYESYPFSPWAPPGMTTAKNCAQRVIDHMYCARHRLEYTSWIWNSHRGSLDFGFQDENTMAPFQVMEIPHLELVNQDASQAASINCFRWVVDNGEGVPKELAYRDSWLDVIYSGSVDDDDDDDDDDNSLDETNQSSHESGSRCSSSSRLQKTCPDIKLWLTDTEEADESKRLSTS